MLRGIEMRLLVGNDYIVVPCDSPHVVARFVA
jgi:hypothetical protein